MTDEIDDFIDNPDEFHRLLAQASTGDQSTISALRWDDRVRQRRLYYPYSTDAEDQSTTLTRTWAGVRHDPYPSSGAISTRVNKYGMAETR